MALSAVFLLNLYALPAFARGSNAAIVIDANNGSVLQQSKADEPRYPASITKVMTLYLLFEEMERGRFKLDSKLKVSTYASQRPPSKLGVKPGDDIRVEDAILALVTRSANDVAVTIAENIAGSEDAFAALMTRKARQLGMSNTTYKNASGLPDPNQKTTARDLALLGRSMYERFPTYARYFSTRAYYYKGKAIGNHNKLLGRVAGVDGIKTGYTHASGFNLLTSVHQGGRHLVAVVLGGRTGGQRDAAMRTLIASYLPKASRTKVVDKQLIARIFGKDNNKDSNIAVAANDTKGKKKKTEQTTFAQAAEMLEAAAEENSGCSARTSAAAEEKPARYRNSRPCRSRRGRWRRRGYGRSRNGSGSATGRRDAAPCRRQDSHGMEYRRTSCHEAEGDRDSLVRPDAAAESQDNGLGGADRRHKFGKRCDEDPQRGKGQAEARQSSTLHGTRGSRHGDDLSRALRRFPGAENGGSHLLGAQAQILCLHNPATVITCLESCNAF